MGVDGGAGNAISLSEVQTFYGGSNPISMSEYYRNGSLVPGDLVAAQGNTSGSSSQTIGQFGVTVTPSFGSVNDSGNRSTGVGGGGVSPYAVVSNDASITCSGGGVTTTARRLLRCGSHEADQLYLMQAGLLGAPRLLACFSKVQRMMAADLIFLEPNRRFYK